MTKNKERSIKNLCFSALGQIITIAIGLILPRIYMVNFGPETHGLLNSANQYVVYLGLFEAGVGAVTLQALYKPVAERDQNSINSILSATNYYYKRTSIYYLIGLIILSLVYPFIAHAKLEYWVVCGCIFLSGIGNVVVFALQGKYRFLLEAEGKNYITVNLNTIVTVLTGIAKVVLVALGYNVIIVLLASFVIHCLQTVYILIYIKRYYKWLNLKVEPNKKAISQKNYTLLHQIAGLVFQNTDILILTIFCDLKVVSVYSIYKLITTHLENVLNIISNSFNFILGQAFQKNKEIFKQGIDLFESIYSAIAFALFATTLFLYCPFMQLYTSGVEGINYIDSKLAILFVIIALLTAARMPMLKVIQYAGHFKLTTPQTILETAINLIVSLVGVYLWGIYGVLLGTVVALFYRTNDVIIYSNIKLLKRSPLKTYSIYFINTTIFLLLQVIFKIIFSTWKIDSWLDFIGIGSIAIVIALLCFISIQFIIFPENRNQIINIFKKRS